MKLPCAQTFFSVVTLGLLGLTGCDPYQPTMRPDYTIAVVPSAQSSVAIAPTCPSWATQNADPYDNQPLPQFGCASARNLADMVENPDDLVMGRSLAESRGVTHVGAVRRYDNNQTRGLVWTGTEDNQVANTTAPVAASPMTGDVTGGAGSSSSTSAASTAASP